MNNETSDFVLGRHIVIWGATGSGKTTLAQELGRRLGLVVVDLDAIRHANGWDSTPWDEFRVRLTETLERHAQGWLTAGSYSPIMDVYLSRADTMIWLRLPWRVSFWRLLQRTITRARSQEEYYEGSPARESWRQSFFSRRSILLWSITHHQSGKRSVRQRIAALPAHVKVYELGSAKEVGALLASAERQGVTD